MQPETVQTPPSAPAPSNQMPPKKSVNKKWVIIGSIAIVVVLALVVGIKIALNHATTNSNTDSKRDSAFYYDRPGYNGEELGAGIGDPLALTMDKTSDHIFRSPGGPIAYACSVVTLKELTDNKVYITARPDTRAVTRTFVDGVGKATVTPNVYSLPIADDDDNNCNYSLQSGGLFTISVYQPPFTAKEAVTHELDRVYTKTDSINGLETYRYTHDDASRSTYMLLSGNDAINVLFNGTKLSQDTKTKLLELAAKNFTALQASPKGPQIANYDSPTYKKTYAKACDFISNDDIKALTGADASVYATEGLASSTGIVKANGTLYNSIATSCTRMNSGLGSGLVAGPFDQKLEVTITSFNADNGAIAAMKAIAQDAADKVKATIGSDAIGYRDGAGQNTVLFRQGRFMVELVFDRTAQDNAGLQETSVMTQKLTPYAQQVANKLKAME